MNSKLVITFSILLVTLLAFAGCKKSEDQSGSDKQVGKSAKKIVDSGKEAAQSVADSATGYAFSLTDQNGTKVNLSDYADKVIVLEWFNPDCPFVQRHYKTGTFAKLANNYKDKGVLWFAVNTTHYFNQEKNKAFHTEHELPYPVLDDRTGKIGKLFEAKTTPHMFILDTKGKIAYNGAIDDDPRGSKGDGAVNYVKKALDELLAGKAVSTSQIKPYGCSVKYAN